MRKKEKGGKIVTKEKREEEKGERCQPLVLFAIREEKGKKRVV